MSIDWHNLDDKMSVLDKARMCLKEFNDNLTIKQKELLNTNNFHSMSLPFNEMYERMRLINYVGGLNKVIGIHENMPSPVESEKPKSTSFKKWTPADYHNRDF